MSNRLYAENRSNMVAEAANDKPHSWQVELRRAEEARAMAMGEMIGRLAVRIRKLFAGWSESIARARVANELSALDDRMLADIGLKRSDIPGFVAGQVEMAREVVARSHRAEDLRKAA